MRKFTEKVINQVNNIFNGNYNGNNKELIMALFMQIFSYKFDDRVESIVKFKDIDSIAKVTWKSIPNKTNELVGIPFFTDESEKSKFYSYDLNEKTQYILNEIRGSIVHGAFEFNNDGTITITDEMFKMTFEFECIVDICSIITMNELNITDEKANELYDFLIFVNNLNDTSDDFNKMKIMHSFSELKYPIIMFNLLPMNEDDFHNDLEYASMIIELFSDKEFYKKGRLKDNSSLRKEELYRLRNCIAHGEYYSSNDDLVLFDGKQSYVFNCLKLDEMFNLKNESRTI